MEKRKVCFPCYGGCEFLNLKEALNYVKQMPGGLSVYIMDIVLYNIRFRDCLREEGIEGVIKKLFDEAPEIAYETDALDNLKEKWRGRMKERIADYDIRCLPKDDWILIEDCLFDGLNDIDSQAEICGNPRHLFKKWYTREGYIRNPAGMHVGDIYENYPVFDSYDVGDNRCYHNYVFSRVPLTEEMMEEYCNKISSHFNNCMVHEDIPEVLLPIIYYNGDSDYVLLATAKQKQ